jgi:hypothetical protein
MNMAAAVANPRTFETELSKKRTGSEGLEKPRRAHTPKTRNIAPRK